MANHSKKDEDDKFVGGNVNNVNNLLSYLGVPMHGASGDGAPPKRPNLNQKWPPPENMPKDTAFDMYKKQLAKLEEQENEIEKVEKEIKQTQSFLKSMELMLKSMENNALLIGEVVSCAKNGYYIVQLCGGTQYLVGVNKKVNTDRLCKGCRVAMDPNTHTIMTCLPRLININVRRMLYDGSSPVTFKMIGGLTDQIRSIREVVELPLKKPEVFKRIGIKLPRRILLYGPPGTGKTMLAKAVASQLKCNFIKICGSSIIDKYVGESAKIIRDMFAYAKSHTPSVIFIDEVDAIGGKRVAGAGSADREVQRCMLELLHQLDGFDVLDKVSVIMATNRPDILDPALLRPGRMDRKLEIPLPNEPARLEILKVHADKLTTNGTFNLSEIAQMTHGLNGADLRGICTEAGYLALRESRSFITQDDMMKAARKMMDTKLLEKKMDYKPS